MEKIKIDIGNVESFPESEFINLSKAIIIKEDEVFIAISLDFNIAFDAENIKIAKENLNLAIKDYLESCIEDNISFFRPVSPTELASYEILERYEIEINHNILEYA